MNETKAGHHATVSSIERDLQRRLEQEGLTPHQATNAVSEFISSRPAVALGEVDLQTAWQLLLEAAVRFLEDVHPMHYRIEHLRQLSVR